VFGQKNSMDMLFASDLPALAAARLHRVATTLNQHNI
jgi:hypothetical protein